MTRPKPFPTHFKIILTEHERIALDTLYERDPHLIDELELLHEVIAAGIRAKNREAEARGSGSAEPTRTEIEIAKSKRTTAVNGQGRSCRDQEPALFPVPHRHVELYLGFPIDEALRQDLEDFLDANESLDEETAYALLLRRGLDRVNQGEEPHDEAADVAQVGMTSRSTRARRSLRRRRLLQVVGSEG